MKKRSLLCVMLVVLLAAIDITASNGCSSASGQGLKPILVRRYRLQTSTSFISSTYDKISTGSWISVETRTAGFLPGDTVYNTTDTVIVIKDTLP